MPLPPGGRPAQAPDYDPAGADVPLSPDDFDIPKKRSFSPAEFGRYVGVCERTIVREIEDGKLRALRVRAGYRIPYREIACYFLRQQGAMN
ncbi:MAG TPA: excisionase family DNA-binding protein [Thermoanaerobaculia bacterium]|nr:excisionase family DNA-binding protein [Thermoanaerobaculia bacterium]